MISSKLLAFLAGISVSLMVAGCGDSDQSNTPVNSTSNQVKNANQPIEPANSKKPNEPKNNSNPSDQNQDPNGDPGFDLSEVDEDEPDTAAQEPLFEGVWKRETIKGGTHDTECAYGDAYNPGGTLREGVYSSTISINKNSGTVQLEFDKYFLDFKSQFFFKSPDLFMARIDIDSAICTFKGNDQYHVCQNVLQKKPFQDGMGLIGSFKTIGPDTLQFELKNDFLCKLTGTAGGPSTAVMHKVQ